MSEEILQQLVKMVSTTNRHQLETKKRLGEMNELLSHMKMSLFHAEDRLANLEENIREVRGCFYRMERMDRQVDKTVSRVDRLEVEMEILQDDRS